MKFLIKKILKEITINKINEWENNINDFGEVLSTLIWYDDENGEKLYLFVGFNFYGNLTAFSYSFILLDSNNKPLTDYMTEKNEVSKYIPKELKNTKQIFPIVKGLTRKLLNKMLPEEIYRKTVEPLSGDSLTRYHEITNIMVNEYDYSLKETYVDQDGCTVWKLIKTKETKINKNMEESYKLGGIPNGKQILKDTFDKILPLLPKITN